MLRIRKLYSEPITFDPIVFKDGVNLIFGEMTEGNDKTNGVGKSMAIEFLNYGLLKKHVDSRVALIPNEAFSQDVFICLDFEIRGKLITTKRCVAAQQTPTIIVDGRETVYASLEDATEYLTTLLFGTSNDESVPSFRSILGPLIREERSEFKSITKCYDTDRNIPADYTPHLYLLGVDPQPYKTAKQRGLEIETISKAASKIKENIETITGKNITEAKADLNELTSQVERIKADIERLENVRGYDFVKEEIIEIENKIERERSRQDVLKSELSKIKLFRGDNYIDDKEVAELYNQFKDGLGDLISKELQEVTAFKRKIDNFQRNLIDNRRNSLNEEIQNIEGRITALDRQYKERLLVLDQTGLLKSLKQTIATHQQKAEELAALSAFVKKYADFEREKKEKRNEREGLIYALDISVIDAKIIISSFEKTILDIHEYVAGNRSSSFDITTTRKKEVINFELRIYDDGSHSNDREKVFLYDLALLINPDTAKRHPGLLVHDNIFDVDQDTLIKSLNFLGENLNLLANKQYILTINRGFAQVAHKTVSDLCSLNPTYAACPPTAISPQNVGAIPSSNID